MPSNERLSQRLVRVGDVTVGLIGLDEILRAVRADGFEPNEAAAGELVARARRHNYIPGAAEGEYAQALLREFDKFCEQQAEGCACAVGYGTWRGQPRETIPWFPTIYAELCDGCEACLRFCQFGVFTKDDGDKVQVVEPFKCQVGCSSCVQTCKPKALSFPPKQMLEAFGG